MGKADMDQSYRTYEKIAREDHSKHTRLGSLSDLTIDTGHSARGNSWISGIYIKPMYGVPSLFRCTVPLNGSHIF